MKTSFHSEENAVEISNSYSESYIRLAQNKLIFLSEDITKKTAAELSALLLYYDNNCADDKPIELYINSLGGEAGALSHMYDIMQMIATPIKTICLGQAYSAGAVLLAAGTKGKRYATKHAEIMIHGIQFLFPLPGHDQTKSKKYLDSIYSHNDIIMEILAHHTGHNLDKLKQDCQQDVYMDAQSALKYGIIDHII